MWEYADSDAHPNAPAAALPDAEALLLL